MERELFNLCKQVYEATGYDNELILNYIRHVKDVDIYFEIDDRQSEDEWKLIPAFNENNASVPLYTSDYLLEKLPREIDSHVHEGETASLWINYGDFTFVSNAWAGYSHEIQGEADYGRNADTPLKALLKLTLALHEAGELI